MRNKKIQFKQMSNTTWKQPTSPYGANKNNNKQQPQVPRHTWRNPIGGFNTNVEFNGLHSWNNYNNLIFGSTVSMTDWHNNNNNNYKYMKEKKFFQTIRIISFRNSQTNMMGRIVYLSPSTEIDDFDISMYRWLHELEQLYIKDVNTQIKSIKYFSTIKQEFEKMTTQKLLLICRGDYNIVDEIIINDGKFTAPTFQLNIQIYWEALSLKLPNISEFVTFDNNKEQYFLETKKNIEFL